MWAISTRVDPATDVTVIPDVSSHPRDPTARELGTTGQPGWQRLGSKVLIDATKPPLNAPEARSQFERIRPPGIDRIRLQDFLA